MLSVARKREEGNVCSPVGKLAFLSLPFPFESTFLLYSPLISKLGCSIVITRNFVKLSFEENLGCRGSSTLMADSSYPRRVNAEHIQLQFSYYSVPTLDTLTTSWPNLSARDVVWHALLSFSPFFPIKPRYSEAKTSRRRPLKISLVKGHVPRGGDWEISRYDDIMKEVGPSVRNLRKWRA